MKCAPASALLIITAVACSDPAEPGGCPDACAPAVVDLAVDSARIVSSGIGAHPVTGRRAVSPYGLRVEYSLTNHGDTAAATVVRIDVMDTDVTVYSGVIEPGESVDRHVVIDTVRARRFAGSDLGFARITAFAVGDTSFINGFVTSDTVHIAVPILRIAHDHGPDRVRVNEPVTSPMRVRNLSLFAESPALSVTACLFDESVWCYPGGFSTFLPLEIPALPPGGEMMFGGTFAIPAAAAWQDADQEYSLDLCTVAAGSSSAYLDPTSTSCVFWRRITVMPDYEGACAPPALAEGVQHDFAAFNCGNAPFVDWGFEYAAAVRPFHLASFQAEAGVTYTVNVSSQPAVLRFQDESGGPVFDLAAGANAVRVGEASRIHVAVYAGDPAMSIVVSQ